MINIGLITVYDHTKYLINLNKNDDIGWNTVYDHTKYLINLNKNDKHWVKYRLWS